MSSCLESCSHVPMAIPRRSWGSWCFLEYQSNIQQNVYAYSELVSIAPAQVCTFGKCACMRVPVSVSVLPWHIQECVWVWMCLCGGVYVCVYSKTCGITLVCIK
eukprot:scpid109628/ scgid28640/ 